MVTQIRDLILPLTTDSKLYELLANEYPDLVEVQNFGKSFEGRNLTMVYISTDRKDTPRVERVKLRLHRPVVLLDAGIHAREWIAPSMSLYILNLLVEHHQDNKELLQKFDWIIIPVLNPDGYEYSHVGDRLWRKTRSTLTSSPDCIGVDANRNFRFHWKEDDSHAKPCDEDYPGDQAFSEPETRALRDLMKAHNVQLYLTLHSFGNFILYPYGYTYEAPEGWWDLQDIAFEVLAHNVQLYLTLHSFGNFILYPYGYTYDAPEGWWDLQDIAFEAAGAIMEHHGPSYTTGSSSAVLYPAAGGSDDYAYGAAGLKFAFTIELPKGGDTGFDPEPKDMMKIFEETMFGFRVIVRMAGEHF
ncbi:carboxypeptidase B-like [Ctenocephalides felis]|uniref:carboxypeptidase B-like n=1 Tax=Ctenocephalides felis TaxID=7515 RepID=UPI000E6E2F0B|nr:carboxypeptidase B-like [Ctenocephalides felis]